MALALTGFELEFQLLGTQDGNRSKVFEIAAVGADEAAQRANAITETAAMVTAFSAVTEAVIVGYFLREIWEEATPAAPPATAYVYDEAFVTVKLDGVNKKANIAIPAPAPGIFVGDDKTQPVIDTADTALTTFVSEFNPASSFRVSDGEAIEVGGILSARLRSVRSGKSY